jgi:hypothetical protein
MFKLLPYNAHRRRKYKRTAICLQGSLLNCWPVVEDESLHVMNEIQKTGTVIGLTEKSANINTVLEVGLQEQQTPKK